MIRRPEGGNENARMTRMPECENARMGAESKTGTERRAAMMDSFFATCKINIIELSELMTRMLTQIPIIQSSVWKNFSRKIFDNIFLYLYQHASYRMLTDLLHPCFRTDTGSDPEMSTPRGVRQYFFYASFGYIPLKKASYKFIHSYWAFDYRGG